MDKREHKQRFDAGLKTRREVLGAGQLGGAPRGHWPPALAWRRPPAGAAGAGP